MLPICSRPSLRELSSCRKEGCALRLLLRIRIRIPVRIRIPAAICGKLRRNVFRRFPPFFPLTDSLPHDIMHFVPRKWSVGSVINRIIIRNIRWSVGSVGRAHRSHRWGHWFESSTDHTEIMTTLAVVIIFVSPVAISEPVSPRCETSMGQTKEASPLWGVPKASDLSLLARKGEQTPLQGV